MIIDEVKVGDRILWRMFWGSYLNESIVEEITLGGRLRLGGVWHDVEEIPNIVIEENLGPVAKP